MSFAHPPHPDHRLTARRQRRRAAVHVSGDIDPQAVRIADWRKIAEHGKARGARKLLVTDRKKGRPATPAELAVIFQDGAVHFDRVAVVEPAPAFVPPVQYAAIFGQSLRTHVRVFSDAAAAERWLRYGSPDD